MKETIKAQIAEWAKKYLYRPLPKKIRAEAYELYSKGLNGFDSEVPKEPRIAGVLIASGYTRVVVGDYGPWLEIAPEQLLVRESLEVPWNQRWRLDSQFCKDRELSIKYHWYQLGSVKVYYQVKTVKYADYQPGFFYISTLDFD